MMNTSFSVQYDVSPKVSCGGKGSGNLAAFALARFAAMCEEWVNRKCPRIASLIYNV